MAGAVVVLGVAGSVLNPAMAAAQDHIALAWDNQTTGLSWHPGSAATATGSLVGDPVVVPGDRDERTFHIRNDGPTTASATVEIADVSCAVVDDTVNDELDDLIHLTWAVNGHSHDMTWHQAIHSGNPTWVARFAVPPGGVFTVTAGYYFPAGSTDGRVTDDRERHALSFNVHVTLTGETASSPSSPATPSPTPPADDPSTPGWGAGTGGAASGLAWYGWAAIAAVAGALALGDAWRRRRVSEGRMPSRPAV